VGLDLKSVRLKGRSVVLLLAILLAACTATGPAPHAAETPDANPPDLACPLAGNCVSSLGSGGLAALQYAGAPARAMELLQATVTTFTEASVVRREPLAMRVIFTTPAGFRDQVDFLIDPQAQRVDFRSRSLFGLFDWGKNRSRMLEFKSRFEQKARL
jgi:uncharacterized protein (DUF1499 family)